MKELINSLISIFTRVVTSIFIFTSIYLIAFVGFSAKFDIFDILFILLIGLISAVCYIPFLVDKSISKTKMLIMEIVYFLIINTIVLIIGNYSGWFCFTQIASFLAFEGVIVAVYAFVLFISYKVDSNTADQLNKKLHDRNK